MTANLFSAEVMSGRSPEEEGTETLRTAVVREALRPAEVLKKKELKQTHRQSQAKVRSPAEVLKKKELKRRRI